MRNLTGQFRALFMAAAIGIAAMPAARAADAAIPATPEAGSFKIGIEPWLGYGQWHVAQAKDLFKANGLSDVQIVNFSEDKDINAALASGQLDGASLATHTAIAMAANGLPIKIVMLLDVSLTADAIIAGKDIKSIADLKGKQVAFEQGTTSDILMNYALASAGMSVKDIDVVAMPAADAGAALVAGRVPVAVTYEPYLTVALKQDPKLKLLFSAGADPGLVSDVLVVREDVLKNRPGQVIAMIEAWDAALAAYEKDTPAGRSIIAKAVGSNAQELDTAFDGIRFYSLAENKAALGKEFAAKTFENVKAAARKAGIITADIAAKAVVVPAFVDGAP